MSVLRPSIFCELWKNFVSRRRAEAGADKETSEHSLSFEIGGVFYDGQERRMLGIIGGGNVLRASMVATEGIQRAAPAVEVDFYFLKNIVEKISRLVCAEITPEFRVSDVKEKSDYLAYRININLFDAKSGDRIPVGTIGPVSPGLALEEGIKSPVWWLEMGIDPLVSALAKYCRHPIFKPYPAYPAATMDFSFFMPTQNSPILIGDVEQEIRRVVSGVSPRMVAEEVFPVDIWRSAGDATRPEGRTSVTLRLVVRSFDGTLEAGQLKILSDGIIKHLSDKFGLVMRTSPDKK